MAKSIGIDIGGTNLRVGIFNELNLLEVTRHQAEFSNICKKNTPDEAWQKILHVLSEAISVNLDKHPDVQAIGIGFPGFIDPQTQTIAQSPNLPGLINVNLSKDLSKLISKKVIVENDANAAAYGEYSLLGKPESGLIYFGLGTGVGGGLIQGGIPFVGFHGCAMEVGHIIIEPNGRLCGCGNLGCMEQYASASGVSMSYGKENITVSEIANLARMGDKDAQVAYSIAGEALAKACS
jgi:glucokinase